MVKLDIRILLAENWMRSFSLHTFCGHLKGSRESVPSEYAFVGAGGWQNTWIFIRLLGSNAMVCALCIVSA